MEDNSVNFDFIGGTDSIFGESANKDTTNDGNISINENTTTSERTITSESTTTSESTSTNENITSNSANKTSERMSSVDVEIAMEKLPYEFKPISMWGYFGYDVLFLIPIIGFIVMIILALGGTANVNVKNYARSKFCILIVALAILGLLCLITGTAAVFGVLPDIKNYMPK